MSLSDLKKFHFKTVTIIFPRRELHLRNEAWLNVKKRIPYQSRVYKQFSEQYIGCTISSQILPGLQKTISIQSYDAHREASFFRISLVAVALAAREHDLPDPVPRRILLPRGHVMATFGQLLGRHEDTSAMRERHLPHRSRAKRARQFHRRLRGRYRLAAAGHEPWENPSWQVRSPRSFRPAYHA